jgi:hypothetical protein
MTALTTKLIVDALHPAIRIEVLNAGYRVCAKGYGRIEENLPTGLYTVRYAAGDAVAERDITLRPDEALTLNEQPELAFASAAPIDLTRTSHEYHQDHAQQLSHALPLEQGRGGQLFVFVRDVSLGGSKSLTKGLSLHRLDGEMLLQFDQVVEASTEKNQARWAGRNIALDPGTYRLRLSLGRRRAVEMAVVVCPDWQSQVFLLREGGESEAAGRPILDLAGATQLMGRPGQGFELMSRAGQRHVGAGEAGEDLRLAELARQALAHGRQGIHTRDLGLMLNGKWRDPVLGIFGVHLLLMRPEPDLDLAERVVERLRSGILPGFRHPDIEILSAEIARRRGLPIDMLPLEVPPMLRRSWHMLVQATAVRPDLIPSDSLAARVADQLWGTGAWLIWQIPPDVPARPQSEVLLGSSLEGEGRAAPEPGIEELIDWVVDGAVMLFKPDVLTEEWIRDLVKHPEAISRQLADLGYSTMRAAIESLLTELSRLIEQPDWEELARQAKLDTTEFALLVQIAALLPARRHTQETPAHDPLPLATLILRLDLPAERIQGAMADLFLKLLALLTRRR